MGFHADLSFCLANPQVVGVKGKVAGQRGNLQVGNRGVQVDGAGDALEMHIAEDLAILRDLAFDLG